MIDPRTKYIVYKAEENQRMKEIGWRQMAKENGGYVENDRRWLFEAGKWLKEKVFAWVIGKEARGEMKVSEL